MCSHVREKGFKLVANSREVGGHGHEDDIEAQGVRGSRWVDDAVGRNLGRIQGRKNKWRRFGGQSSSPSAFDGGHHVMNQKIKSRQPKYVAWSLERLKHKCSVVMGYK